MITTYDILLKSSPIGNSIIKSDKCDLIPDQGMYSYKRSTG